MLLPAVLRKVLQHVSSQTEQYLDYYYTKIILKLHVYVCMCACVMGGQRSHLTSTQTLAHLSMSSLEDTGRVLLKAHATGLATGKSLA